MPAHARPMFCRFGNLGRFPAFGNQMPLPQYRKKRTFNQTPEPAGGVRRGSRTRIFVVQKHDATRLHYDFRLAISAVLVSWAVPKRPSMNPPDKPLTIRT